MSLESTLLLVGVASVVILVIYETIKFAKAHPANPIVQAAEMKVPAPLLSAAGLAVTGDHLVAAVAATGQAVATAVQAVTAQKPEALLGNSGLPPVPNVTPTPAGGDQGQSMMLNALLGSQTIKRPEVVQPPADDPTKRAPYPSYWRFNGNAPGEIHSPGFTCPAADYVTSTDFSGNFVVKVDGVEVSQLQPFPMSEGSHTASVVNPHEGTWTGTLQFRKYEPVHANLPK